MLAGSNYVYYFGTLSSVREYCNSFDDYVPVAEIYKNRVFNCTMTVPKDSS